jgi:hypothetical protein
MFYCDVILVFSFLLLDILDLTDRYNETIFRDMYICG